MIDLVETAVGIILPIQAQAGARKNAVTGAHDGRLRVSVTQAPGKGKANRAIVEHLAKLLGVKRNQIAVVAGETSSHKKLLISGVSIADLRARTDALLVSSSGSPE